MLNAHLTALDHEITFRRSLNDDVPFRRALDDDVTFRRALDDDVTFKWALDDDVTFIWAIDDDFTFNSNQMSVTVHSFSFYLNQKDSVALLSSESKSLSHIHFI